MGYGYVADDAGKMQLVVIRQMGKQFQTVKTQLYRKDIGERSSLQQMQDGRRAGGQMDSGKANCHKPIRRLWISSVTDKAIREGFAHLEDGRKYQHLYEGSSMPCGGRLAGGYERNQSTDRKHNAQLSCGRVQTPTLAMIAKKRSTDKRICATGILWNFPA